MANIDELDKIFEKQYKKFEVVDGGDRKIKITHLIPPNVSSDIPVFIAPGWSETSGVFKEVLRHMFRYGREIITLDHPPRGGDQNVAHPEHSRNDLRKASNLIKVLEARAVDRADFVTHSEGAINTTVAALIAPELFRSIIYVNPSGMIGDMKFIHAVRGILAKLSDDISRAVREKEIRKQYRNRHVQGVLYVLQNPLRAISEVFSTSTKEIHHLIKQLKEHNIRIGIIAGDDDVLYPAEKIKKYVDQEHLDAYLVVHGAHDELHYHPEHYSRQIMSMLAEIN